jgi:hypothetical protein
VPDPRGQRWLAIVQRLFLALALAAIATYLVRHRDELAGVPWPSLLGVLAPVLVLQVIAHGVLALAFHWVARSVGIERAPAAAFGSYFRRIPARYIPGGVWHTAARYLDLHVEQRTGKAMLARLAIVEVVLVATAGFLVALLAGVLLTGSVNGGARLLALQGLAVVAGAAAIAVLMPSGRRLAAGAWLSGALLLIALAWLLAGTTFALVTGALVGGCEPTSLASTYLSAATVGYVAIFAPQGWGVSELAFDYLLPCAVDLALVLLGFVVFRVIGIGSDLLAFAGWWLLAGRRAGAATSR